MKRISTGIAIPLVRLQTQDIDSFYAAVHAAKAKGKTLIIQCNDLSFVAPEGILAILNVARLWYEWSGTQIILRNLQPQVHKYLERADLFSRCSEWVRSDQILNRDEYYSRSVSSYNLLELTRISSDEVENGDDVTDALEHAQRILKTWFSNTHDVKNLLNIFSEIATNIAHSKDIGFVLIQRYGAMDSPESRVIISIADLGIGIERSLRDNPAKIQLEQSERLESGSDYILQALKLGVTSRGQVAGVGLHQVRNIVETWRGSLTIRSARSKVRFSRETSAVWNTLAEMRGTQVSIEVRGSIVPLH